MNQRRQGGAKLEIAFGRTAGTVIDSMNEEERRLLDLPFAAESSGSEQVLIVGWVERHRVSFFIVIEGRRTLFTRTRDVPSFPDDSKDLPRYVHSLGREIVISIGRALKGQFESPVDSIGNKVRWSRNELEKGVTRCRDEIKAKMASHNDAILSFVTSWLPNDYATLISKTTVGLEHLNALDLARDPRSDENLVAQELIFYPAIAGPVLENHDIIKELASGTSLEEAFERAFSLDHEGWKVLSLLEQSGIAQYGQEYLFPVSMIALSVMDSEILESVASVADARSLYNVITTLVWVIEEAYVKAKSDYADSHVNMGYIVGYLINRETSPLQISAPDEFLAVFQLIAERIIHDACVPALHSFETGTMSDGDWEGMGGLVMQNLIWQLGVRASFSAVGRYQGSVAHETQSPEELQELSRIAAEVLAMAFPKLTERERGIAVMTDLPNTLTWRHR
ncbi:hypothetical protein O9X98_06880 [Agrobacterium salinitolerans]|nr:hypothetical protein [Agrobacterium salinitolerans]